MKTFLKVWLSISLIAIAIGVGLLVIAVGTGARWEDVATFSMDESYEKVESIDMDISYGDVKIIQGNEFAISASNLPEDHFDSYVEDGIWYIKEESNNRIDFFGLDIPVGNFISLGDDLLPDITITLPKDFVAGNFKLNVSAGNVVAESVNALEGEFTVDAGRIQIDQLAVSGKSSYNVDTGEIVLNDISANDISLDCGVGNVEINGVVTGDNNIQCDVGNVDLNLKGDKLDYSYDISSDIGEVEIEGDDFHNTSNKIIDNNEADNSLYLKCDIGKISVEFN